ncbi:MAG: hypothetical protein V3T31_06230 [candidate division Zixibacteria bacterium]
MPSVKNDDVVRYICELIGWSPVDVVNEIEGYPVRNRGADVNWKVLGEAGEDGRDDFIRGFFGAALFPEG